MGTEAPTPIVIPVRCAPKKAPCPKCGKRGRRKRTLTRTVRTVAYKAIAFLEITYGEYAARCDCSTTFRNTPEGVLPKAKYDNKVRDLVLERILKDGMSVERTLESLRREFLLDLSSGFVYDVLRDRAAQLDMAAHRRKVLEHFSGTLCVDELHLGRFTLLLATDPLARPAGGLRPGRRQRPGPHAAVPEEPQDLGPEPRGRGHRRLEPVPRRAGRAVARRGPPVVRLPRHQGHQQADPRRRAAAADGDGPAGQGRAEEEAGPQGRPRPRPPPARRGLTVKEKAHFVFKHRHLIVKRRENLTEAERDDLTRMLEYLPELATLRRFADRIYWLFDAPKDFHQASCRRSAIVRDPAFRAVPELVKAMEQLDEEKFPKLMAYLNNPVSRRVRTNNHVERTNRMFRFLEKVRYKWRRRRTLVRFVVLVLDATGGHGLQARRRTPIPRSRSGAARRESTTATITPSRLKSWWSSARSYVISLELVDEGPAGISTRRAASRPPPEIRVPILRSPTREGRNQAGSRE